MLEAVSLSISRWVGGREGGTMGSKVKNYMQSHSNMARSIPDLKVETGVPKINFF